MSEPFDLLSTLDNNEYPTDETLARVRSYDGPVSAFFDELCKVWYLRSWGWYEENGRRRGHKIRRFRLSTAGWSGNEALIDSMRANYFLWHLSWVEEHVGGHFVFEVSPDACIIAAKPEDPVLEPRSFTPRGFENFLEMRDTKNQRVRVCESSVDDKAGGKCVHIFCDDDGPPTPVQSPHLSVDQAERLAWALTAFVARERSPQNEVLPSSQV